MPVLAYLVALIVFVALDATWLAVMGGSYRAQIGPLLASSPRLGPAAAFYGLDVLGLFVFVMLPGRKRGALWIILHGAFFGLVTYGAYDLTSLAVMRRWSLDLTITDMIWGMVVSAIACTLGWLTMRERAGGSRRRR